MIVIARFSYITQHYQYNELAMPHVATQIRGSILTMAAVTTNNTKIYEDFEIADQNNNNNPTT